jgi:hypothetical protein
VLVWLIAVLSLLAACQPAATEEVARAIPTAAPRPTQAAAPTTAAGGLPVVENDAPAGICETTVDVLSRVDRAPASLFRALAYDNRVGTNDGDGIRLVRFTISGEGLAYPYVIEESQAPYCALGGNEPDCGQWTQDAAGRYTWGEGGSVVTPGRYDVFVEIISVYPDSFSESDTCSWSFSMEIDLQ